jgi:hypothetical protein
MAGAPRPTAHGQLGPGRTNPFRFSGPIETIINPRKSKEIQAKRLAFPWIPLVESGLFNGLQRIQIKKSNFEIFTKPRRTTCFSFPARTPFSALITRSKKTIAHIPIPEKTMRARSRAVYMSGQLIPHGWLGGPVAASASGPEPPRPKTAGRISCVRSSKAEHKVAAVKLRAFFARRARASIQLN